MVISFIFASALSILKMALEKVNSNTEEQETTILSKRPMLICYDDHIGGAGVVLNELG